MMDSHLPIEMEKDFHLRKGKYSHSDSLTVIPKNSDSVMPTVKPRHLRNLKGLQMRTG